MSTVAPQADPADIARSLPQTVAGRGLSLVPTLPSSLEDQPTAALCEEAEMSVDDFLDLAVASGTRIIYREILRAEAAEGEELKEEEAGEVPMAPAAQELMTRFQKATAERVGQIRSLNLVFLAGIVVHSLEIEPAWVAETRTLAAELEDVLAEHEEAQETAAHEAAQTEQQRIHDHLVEVPAFRAARTQGEQQAVFRQEFPDIDDHDRPAVWRGISEAAATLQDRARLIYTELEEQLPQLAEEITAQPGWSEVRTVEVRKIRAGDYLQQRSGGYPPSPRILHLLLAEPLMRSKQRRPAPSPQATLPLPA
ncbi:hypothetical protein [Streptomyces longisporoflavus]|uniref:Uncharacterized protein n=1 Tax=Streptomyces longisporoflavus TaxID=28044 RepID=A0ABW7R3F7_9ACTN